MRKEKEHWYHDDGRNNLNIRNIWNKLFIDGLFLWYFSQHFQMKRIRMLYSFPWLIDNYVEIKIIYYWRNPICLSVKLIVDDLNIW